MNPQLKFIFSRRSIRRYADRGIPDAMVQDLLEAAMAAPSACGKDPWEFIVLRDRAVREKIAAGLPNGKMLPQAALGIAVGGDLKRAHGGELSYLLQDCSAAIQNLLLAANALGLGACWLGVHPREDRVLLLRDILQLPDAVVPVGVIAVGWPAETAAPRTRFDPARVHPDCW